MNEDIYDKVSGLRGDKVGEVRAWIYWVREDVLVEQKDTSEQWLEKYDTILYY